MTDDLVAFLRARLDDDQGYAVAFGKKQLLRDVEAKRRIIAIYEEAVPQYQAHRDWPAGELDGLRTAIACLATAYADHPDYREEWKP